MGEDVAEEMDDPAALPGRTDEGRRDRLPEPGVGVADDELDSREAAGDEGPQEGAPQRSGLAVADLEAEHRSLARSFTPMAMRIAIWTILLPSRTFSTFASSQTYG